MWTGSEWIPAPPKSPEASANVNLHDSVISGDVSITHNEANPDAIGEGFKKAITEINEKQNTVEFDDTVLENWWVYNFVKSRPWYDEDSPKIRRKTSPSKKEIIQLGKKWLDGELPDWGFGFGISIDCGPWYNEFEAVKLEKISGDQEQMYKIRPPIAIGDFSNKDPEDITIDYYPDMRYENLSKELLLKWIKIIVEHDYTDYRKVAEDYMRGM
jgi:hypothetical protein